MPVSSLIIRPNSIRPVLEKLANSQEILEGEQSNIRLVLRLYHALSVRDVDTVHRLLLPDIEYWFHGPPCHQQHMINLLTGSNTNQSFAFEPTSRITSFGSTVLAEGCDHSGSVSWVHAWTVSNGVIIQIREYFNTSLTVARFEDCNQQSSSSSSSSSSSVHWQSKLSGESVPGLVLAI
ncbi:hypothetical protein IFM89_021225 [Coptis chinensis]|uniref:Wound-induced protein 1 n=1 Tax=Coptis chinensis TaxID=261450 RepID=A0A835HGJ0_9MAGN|nr:hypothetical protein IFM89_021225 [Coptis chinensis]